MNIWIYILLAVLTVLLSYLGIVVVSAVKLALSLSKQQRKAIIDRSELHKQVMNDLKKNNEKK